MAARARSPAAGPAATTGKRGLAAVLPIGVWQGHCRRGVGTLRRPYPRSVSRARVASGRCPSLQRGRVRPAAPGNARTLGSPCSSRRSGNRWTAKPRSQCRAHGCTGIEAGDLTAGVRFRWHCPPCILPTGDGSIHESGRLDVPDSLFQRRHRVDLAAKRGHGRLQWRIIVRSVAWLWRRC